MNWKEHEFDIPLGIELPDKVLSSGEDWWDDCDEDDVFGLKPCYYSSKNLYDAALKLCHVCGGWFYFETEEDQNKEIDLLRKMLTATEKSPLNYYDVQYGRFDWVAALRENNEQYFDKFYEIDNLWELYCRLGERSILDKALCYEWFVTYFSDYIKYDRMHELQNGYLQNYNGELEMILYLRPNQIEILTEGDTAVETNNLPQLSSAAAGLIRLGKRTEGIALYKKVFDIVWERKTTSDDKKEVMDSFLERLSKGYENEPYIDSEISKVLEEQCKKYTDNKWIAKIKVSLGLNGI